MSIFELLIIVAVFAAIVAMVYIHRDHVKDDLVIDAKAVEDYVAKQDAVYRKWVADQVASAEAKAKDAVKAEVAKVL